MLRRKFFSTKKKKIQPRKFFSGSYNSKIENNHVNVFYRKKTESSRRKKHGELFLFIPKKKKYLFHAENRLHFLPLQIFRRPFVIF